MPTIPAPPPSVPAIAPRTAWALWLAGCPGSDLDAVRAAMAAQQVAS